MFALISWVELTEAIAGAAGELGRKYRESHPDIDTADLIVAATAVARDATVATSNVRHFPMIRGLRAVYEA